MANRPKTPTARFSPNAAKVPKSVANPGIHRSPVAAPPSYNNEHPSWRISKIEMVDPFGWHAIGRDKLAEVRAKLAAFESMTWNEILIDGKKQNHSVEIWRLCKQAQDRLSELGLADVERIVSLRLSGIERIWGLRQGVALLVLWWDPDHQICPSILKYT